MNQKPTAFGPNMKWRKWNKLWFSGTTEMLRKWNMPTAFAMLGRKGLGYFRAVGGPPFGNEYVTSVSDNIEITDRLD